MKKMPKNAEIYECEFCNFKCSKKSNYHNHLMTRKHQNRTILNKKKYECARCNKPYYARNSLWYHEQKCCGEDNNSVNGENNYMLDKIDHNYNMSSNNNVCDKDLVIMVMKQQQELMKQNAEFQNKIIEEQNSTQKMMLEVLKQGTHNNNSHNKTFNLQLFLNETCKNAMNLSDFVKSVNVQISDLEKMGELGYVEGISDIIIKNLKDLEIDKRPLHCTDAKREIMYVKDENKWEREEKEKKKLRSAINQVATKNMKLLLDYKDKHPDCVDPDSDESVKFNQMLIEVLGGSENDNEEKVLKKLSKEVVLDKCNDII